MFLLHGSGQVLGPNVEKLTSNILHGCTSPSKYPLNDKLYFIQFILQYIHVQYASPCKKYANCIVNPPNVYMHGWEFPAGYILHVTLYFYYSSCL